MYLIIIFMMTSRRYAKTHGQNDRKIWWTHYLHRALHLLGGDNYSAIRPIGLWRLQLSWRTAELAILLWIHDWTWWIQRNGRETSIPPSR